MIFLSLVRSVQMIIILFLIDKNYYVQSLKGFGFIYNLFSSLVFTLISTIHYGTVTFDM